MRLELSTIGSVAGAVAQEVAAAEAAMSRAVSEASEGLKGELRTQITQAGLGPRLARTWRSRVFPDGRDSISAAGLVWSKAPGIIAMHDRGAVIRSRSGAFLAIPTEAAGRYGDGGRRITPGRWERRHGQRLRFVYRRGGASLLVAQMRARTGQRGGFAPASASALRSGRGLVSVPIFILVPQVTIRKRLDVAGASRRWRDRLAELAVRRWGDGFQASASGSNPARR